MLFDPAGAALRLGAGPGLDDGATAGGTGAGRLTAAAARTMSSGPSRRTLKSGSRGLRCWTAAACARRAPAPPAAGRAGTRRPPSVMREWPPPSARAPLPLRRSLRRRSRCAGAAACSSAATPPAGTVAAHGAAAGALGGGAGALGGSTRLAPGASAAGGHLRRPAAELRTCSAMSLDRAAPACAVAGGLRRHAERRRGRRAARAGDDVRTSPPANCRARLAGVEPGQAPPPRWRSRPICAWPDRRHARATRYRR